MDVWRCRAGIPDGGRLKGIIVAIGSGQRMSKHGHGGLVDEIVMCMVTRGSDGVCMNPLSWTCSSSRA